MNKSSNILEHLFTRIANLELESSGQVRTTDAISNAGPGCLLPPPPSVALITETDATTTVKPRRGSGQERTHLYLW